MLLIVFGVMTAAFGHSDTAGGGVQFQLNGLPALFFFIIVLGYYFVFELVLARTPGKSVLGLRVVRADGAKPGGRAVALRTVLRLIDFLPLFYLVGLVCILSSGQRRQRIGDLAADTTVIKG